MAKVIIILKNQTASPIVLNDLDGLTLPPTPSSVTASDLFETNERIYSSVDLDTEIGVGNIVVNNGTSDLTILQAQNYLQPYNKVDSVDNQIALTPFTDLNDTPASYVGQGLQFVRVNSGETGLEFADPGLAVNLDEAYQAGNGILINGATRPFSVTNNSQNSDAVRIQQTAANTNTALLISYGGAGDSFRIESNLVEARFDQDGFLSLGRVGVLSAMLEIDNNLDGNNLIEGYSLGGNNFTVDAGGTLNISAYAAKSAIDILGNGTQPTIKIDGNGGPAINMPSSVHTTPTIGDFWFEGTRLKYHDGTVSQDVANLNDISSISLDQAYNDGGAGAGRIITADSGPVEITVPDTSATSGLLINQNDITNNPSALTITNTGIGDDFTGSASSISKDGTFIGKAGNFNASATTDAPLEIIPHVVAPTTNLADGQLVVVGDVLYKYDATRVKWLSVESSSFSWGRRGNASGQYLRLGDLRDGTLSGPKMPFNGTITAITVQTNTVLTNPTQGLEIHSNGVNIFAFSLVGGLYTNTAVNVDFLAGDFLFAYVNAIGIGTEDASVIIWIRWRV